jgi:radical SAM superfamily enzyme YgiQ (UPF0313 family)
MPTTEFHPTLDTSTCTPQCQKTNDQTGSQICLVTALTVADFVDIEMTINARNDSGANLGVLTLAAGLRKRGYRPLVVNLDQLFLEFLRRHGAQPRERFCRFAVEHLASLSSDIFGFSSICSSYPLTLRLARDLKRWKPKSHTILGGPQATVTDVATLRAFSCIDFVVRGEADDTLPSLLDCLLTTNRKGSLDKLPGITFRREDEIVRHANAPVVQNLDLLPFPAFDLDPEMKNRASVELEIGRGCPFACTFCSTNDFFRRTFRLKSSPKMIADMKRVKAEYGVTHFSLVHDMYTIDRKKVVEFCQTLLACGEEFTWGCSARTDCIDDELIALMSEAGCRGIFFGIETGSERLQRVINKRLKLQDAKDRIRCADRYGIETAVALITSFPDETRDDLRETIHFFVDSLRLDYTEPQLSLLAPLAATPIHEQYKDQLIFDRIFSDMSHQGWRQDAMDVELISSYPDIFQNFYAVPTFQLDRRYFQEIRDFVTHVTDWFGWLPVALLQDSGDFLRVFDRWRTWLAAKRRADSDSYCAIEPYQCRREFREDFLEFVRGCYLEEMAKAPAAIAALVQIEVSSEPIVETDAPHAADNVECFDTGCIPYPTKDLHIIDLKIDYKLLVEALRNNRDLGSVPETSVTVAFLPKTDEIIEVRQLTPLAARLLRLCDGRRTVHEIIDEFSKVETAVDDVPEEKVAFVGLMLLQEDGFIAASTKPSDHCSDLSLSQVA